MTAALTEARPFHEWLEEHRSGDASQEWAEELAQVLLAVKLTGKKGKVKITLDIDPKGRTVVVTDSIETTIPKPDREAGIYFIDDELSLVRDDPAQQRFQPTDGLKAPAGFDSETGERVEGQ